MDRRSWPWKKKSSDKTTLVVDSATADTSHTQAEKDVVKKPKYVQISVEQYTHLTGLEEQIKTYDVEIKSYESQVEAYDDQVKSFEEQIKTYDVQIKSYESQVEAYEEQVKSFEEQIEAYDEQVQSYAEQVERLNEEIATKEALVKQHSKVAEDAVAGWEKADAEALTLKNTLQSVTLSKLTAEDRAAHLDGALKECMRQIRNLKKDHEVNLHDVALSKSKQIEKLTMEFEKRISDYEQELLRSAADSDALSRTLQERSNMLVMISEEKSRADAEIETLKSNLEMCEKEIKSLKYEVHVVSRELEIRNEEKNMCIRSADVANKQHLEGVKKIAKLEAECQRLRSLVRKKLPGPAALAQMKLEVDNLGGDTRPKRSPSKASSPCKSPRGYSSSGSDFSVDNSQKFQKENEFLTERLLAMEEETKMLKEALAKRNSELLEARNVCAQSTSKLQSLEARLQQNNSQKSSLEVCPNLNTSNPSSSVSVSEDGNDDSGSCSGSLSTTPSQQTKKEKEMAALQRVESVSSQVELMDDFLEMEKLACLPTQSSGNGSMDSKESSGDQKSELVSIEAHTELEQSNRGSPAVKEFRTKLSKVLESVPADADLGKIVEDIKCILQDVNACMDQTKPSDVKVLPEVDDCHLEERNLQSIHQDLKTAVSRIHEFVLFLRKEVRTGEEDTVIEGNDFTELINGFSITFDHVLSGEKKLDDFVLELANVFNEAMELKVTFRGLASSEVEIVSPDCIDKVALPESKAVDKDSSKEIYQNGCSHNEPEAPCDENRDLRYESDSKSQEIEELKSEKEKMAGDIEELKFQLQESEQMLADIRSQLDSAQRSNRLADTQLRCMTESYRSLETRAADLEIDVNQLKEKVRSLENELEDEKRNHKEAIMRCHELEEHIQRNKNTSLVDEDEEEADIKTKQERELTAAAEKLAECQETIFVLGKQLKSLRPQRKSESYSEEEELGTKNYALDEGDSSDTWVNEVPQFMKSPKCPSDSETSDLVTSPSRVSSRLSRSGSSGNPTPEKGSRGISRFFSSKPGY